jgi:hypothetical protein
MLILSPLPRYLSASCCNDNNHAPDRGLNDSQLSLISGLERKNKAITSYWITKRLSHW